MKIFNYSDKPVVIGGIPNDDHIIHLDNGVSIWQVRHDDKAFIPPSDEDRNLVFTITNLTYGGYSIKQDEYTVPDIWLWVSVFLTFFTFYFVIRVFQKIKLS
jgi:hypothetical protein